MNRVRFEGRMGRDPELRTTSTGKTLAKFSLVVRDARNEAQNFFFDCTAWEPVASQVATSFKKNDMIGIDGRLTTNIYTNREGKSVKTYDIIVENAKVLSRSASNSAGAEARKPQGYVSIDDMDAPPPVARPLKPKDKDLDAIFKKETDTTDNNDQGIDWLKDLDE